MSSITFTNINGAFPVAGQDNNSQGFRDNFTNIRNALSVAKNEITDLENNTAKLNADNNFNGKILENAEYRQLNGTVRNNGAFSSLANIDMSLGRLHVFTVDVPASGNGTLTFLNWGDNVPSGNEVFSKVTVHLRNNSTAGTKIVNFANSISGSFRIVSGEFTSSGTTPRLTFNTINEEKVLEAWSPDGGQSVYLKLLGTYQSL
jgi:hypothetical protein